MSKPKYTHIPKKTNCVLLDNLRNAEDSYLW